MCQMRADVISLAHSNCHVLASTHIHSVTEGQTEIIIQIPEIWSNCPDPKETNITRAKGVTRCLGKRTCGRLIRHSPQCPGVGNSYTLFLFSVASRQLSICKTDLGLGRWTAGSLKGLYRPGV